MSDLVRWSEAEGTMRAPRWAQHHARAELAMRQRRGEIGAVFNPREEINPDTRAVEWVVNYIPLRQPRAEIPRRAIALTAILGAVAGVVDETPHARHVIASALLLAGAAAAVALLVAAGISLMRRGGQAGHCPGAWHR